MVTPRTGRSLLCSSVIGSKAGEERYEGTTIVYRLRHGPMALAVWQSAQEWRITGSENNGDPEFPDYMEDY